MRKTIISVLSGVAIGYFIAQNIDKVWLEGMFVDSNLLSHLSKEQRETLKDAPIYKSYAKYDSGSEAYTVNGMEVPFVSIHTGLWADDLTTIHGASHSNSQRDAANVADGSGFAFHVIEGELYAYSSGDVRDNPEMFKGLLADLVQKVESLKVDRDYWTQNESR
ncbi:hypothetical protein [Enterovibrio norvegicus]|uniref:Uncharacterized protein n=1 Tax=Enterovibrio norvegicus TaxID=188144 RepID=A0ABV4L5U4_9GAMM